MKVKLLEPIEGFEEIAEWRCGNKGEVYIGELGKLIQAQCSSGVSHLFLTPKPKKYDWTKTQGHVLIRDYGAPAPLCNFPTTLDAIMLGSPCTKLNTVAEGVRLDSENWIPVLDGVCPFDLEASEISVRLIEDSQWPISLDYNTQMPDFKDIKCVRFDNLRVGYSW